MPMHARQGVCVWDVMGMGDRASSFITKLHHPGLRAWSGRLLLPPARCTVDRGQVVLLDEQQVLELAPRLRDIRPPGRL